MKILFTLKTFLENNRLQIVIISVTALLISFLTIDIVKKFLEPRETAGFSPEQVVEAFYKSINLLDFDTMDDCVIKGAGKGKIQEVMRLSVVYRQAKAFGQRSNLITISDWEKMNKVKLEPHQILYGITDLQIVQENENTFNVIYTKWEYYHDDKKNLQNKKFEAKEKVFLKQDKKDWVIYKIESIEQ